VEFSAGLTSSFFHESSNSICIFEKGNTSTQLKVLDAVTLETTKTYEIKGAFSGFCMVSPDFSIAMMLDPSGQLSLADLTSGDVATANVSAITRQPKIGSLFGGGFSKDMTTVAFCSSTGCYFLDIKSLQLRKLLQAEGGKSFVNVQSVGEQADFVALAETGEIFEVSRNFESVTSSRIELDEPFDISSISQTGKDVALASTEGYDFSVYNVGSKSNKRVVSE
jgi:hypothetical protein